MTFIMLQYVAFKFSISRTFYHEGILYFVKGLSYIYWENHVIFFLKSTYINYTTFVDSHMSNYPCTWEINTT